jgi:hypothetical protein
MEELGFASSAGVIYEPSPSLPGFAPDGTASPATNVPHVAFIGHFYQEAPADSGREIGALSAAVVREWLSFPEQALW